jgi:hypothetical protein
MCSNTTLDTLLRVHVLALPPLRVFSERQVAFDALVEMLYRLLAASDGGPADKDDGDRAQAQAERGSDVSEGKGTWCDRAPHGQKAR